MRTLIKWSKVVATTVEEGFRTFLSRLTPTSGQVAAAAKHRETVESALAAQMTVRRFFQTGSFSNGTGVRSFSDVDYFASLTDRPAGVVHYGAESGAQRPGGAVSADTSTRAPAGGGR
jgi:hypothetical protein